MKVTVCNRFQSSDRNSTRTFWIWNLARESWVLFPLAFYHQTDYCPLLCTNVIVIISQYIQIDISECPWICRYVVGLVYCLWLTLSHYKTAARSNFMLDLGCQIRCNFSETLKSVLVPVKCIGISFFAVFRNCGLFALQTISKNVLLLLLGQH